MRVAVLGTGVVGKALGDGFLALGHEVRMGTRDAANPKAMEWAMDRPRASSGSFADAAQFGELLALCTSGTANKEVLASIPGEALKGKLLLDATMPLEFSTGEPRLCLGHTDSGGEEVQRAAPSAYVVKCFNTVGASLMFQPKLEGGRPDMFIAGNSDEAKEKTRALLDEFGWGTIDLGGIEASRYLEAMAMAWALHGVNSGSWGHAFKMLHK